MDTFRLSSLSVTCARLFFKEGSASAQWPVSASLLACCTTGELLGGSCSPGCAAQTGAITEIRNPQTARPGRSMYGLMINENGRRPTGPPALSSVRAVKSRTLNKTAIVWHPELYY